MPVCNRVKEVSMKRLFEDVLWWLSNRVDNIRDWFDEVKEWWKFIELKASVIIGCVLSAIIIFYAHDFVSTVAPTAQDYAQLEAQVTMIQENPELAFSQEDCSIEVTEDSITVLLSKDNCKIEAVFNKDFELLSTNIEDTYLPMYQYVICLILLWLIVGFFAWMFSMLIIMCMEILIVKLLELKKKHKDEIKNI